MNNLNDEKIAFIRHIWIMNYSELGFGTPVINLFSKFPFHVICTIFLWMALIPNVLSISVHLAMLPVYILASSFVLVVIDSIYTSKKIYHILNLCRRYVDSELTLEQLLQICQN